MAWVACKDRAYMPLAGQEVPFRASYAEAGTHKEDKRIRSHEQPRLELQNLLRTTEEE